MYLGAQGPPRTPASFSFPIKLTPAPQAQKFSMLQDGKQLNHPVLEQEKLENPTPFSGSLPDRNWSPEMTQSHEMNPANAMRGEPETEDLTGPITLVGFEPAAFCTTAHPHTYSCSSITPQAKSCGTAAQDGRPCQSVCSRRKDPKSRSTFKAYNNCSRGGAFMRHSSSLLQAQRREQDSQKLLSCCKC